MKKNSENPSSVSKREDQTIKKGDELSEDELNKVTGGTTPTQEVEKEPIEFVYGKLA
jgi:bacteriocin-like protein